jgi:hypothetical protein
LMPQAEAQSDHEKGAKEQCLPMMNVCRRTSGFAKCFAKSRKQRNAAATLTSHSKMRSVKWG